jgi:multiple antibiotic resistance protein
MAGKSLGGLAAWQSEISGGSGSVADYFLHALVTLFVTIDPVGLAPIFVILTSGLDPADRRKTAIRATVTAGIVLICFALAGEPLIAVLGISLPAFRIAGGLLLFVIAFEMVFARREERKTATAQGAADKVDLQNLAIFPLAIPLISGPGAISATILLASRSPGFAALVGLIVIIVGLVASCLAVFLLADRLERYLGETGRIVVSRLLGVILAALSVQFVADGVVAIVRAAAAG